MLIRWVEPSDKAAWISCASDVADVFCAPDMPSSASFHEYMDNKISQFEALTAVDRMTNEARGFIGFSREHNRISWLGVFTQHRGKGIGSRLLMTALRQLDANHEITVTTFRDDYAQGKAARAVYSKFGFIDKEIIMLGGQPRVLMSRPPSAEKRGGSFHYRYPDWIKQSDAACCPVCTNQPMPSGQIDVASNDIAFICCEYPGQARLFGKIYVMPRTHAFHFEDMPPGDAALFMNEVQRAGRALRTVTGAVKINYEMHANSGAHLHIHLFPRYLDDDFPSAPIDYRVTLPAPYETYEEYLWFVERMREVLARP